MLDRMGFGRAPSVLRYDDGPPLRKHLVSNRTPRAANAVSKHSRLRSPTPSSTTDDTDHALANIRAWTQLLVARGNRLLELAVRERAALAADEGGLRQPIPRKDRDAAAASSSASSHPARGRKENAGTRSKPLA